MSLAERFKKRILPPMVLKKATNHMDAAFNTNCFKQFSINLCAAVTLTLTF